MLKEITPVFKTFSAALGNQTMSGTNTLTSAVTNIFYKDSFAIQLQWTGNPAGNFFIQGSLDYVPELAQASISGPPNAGTWTTIDIFDRTNNPPVAAGQAGQILINMNQLAFPYIRILYTNVTGTGTLSGYIAGKSLG